MNNPLVSVCIPTYNNARYIGKTLESVLRQTYKNIEIIVSDNASTDDTEKIVKSFADERIKYYRNSQNIGAAKNFNRCIQLAKSEYIALYHSDDIYLPQILEKELRLLLKSPNIGMVFALDRVIDENDHVIGLGVNLPVELRGKDIYNFIEIYRALLKKSGSFLVCPTWLSRKSIIEEFGGYTSKYGDWVGGAGDTYLYLKVAQKYLIGIVPERLILRRISQSQGSYQYESTRVSRANHFLVLDIFLDNPQIKKQIDIKTLKQYEYNKFWDDIIIAKNLVKIGCGEEARNLLFKIFSIDKLTFSFASFKNFAKLMIYVFFLIATILNISDFGIKCFRFIKRKKLWS